MAQGSGAGAIQYGESPRAPASPEHWSRVRKAAREGERAEAIRDSNHLQHIRHRQKRQRKPQKRKSDREEREREKRKRGGRAGTRLTGRIKSPVARGSSRRWPASTPAEGPAMACGIWIAPAAATHAAAATHVQWAVRTARRSVSQPAYRPYGQRPPRASARH
jgi:hypothetical protein